MTPAAQVLRLTSKSEAPVTPGHYRLVGPLPADILAKCFAAHEDILIVQNPELPELITPRPKKTSWGDVSAAAERLGVHQSHLSRVLAGKRLSRRLMDRWNALPRDPSGNPQID